MHAADKLSLLPSTDSVEDPGRVQQARGTRRTVPAMSIHRSNYPDGFWFLPLNLNVGGWVKLASLVPFFLAVRLHVLYLSFVNPFFSCLNGIDSFSTSTTTKSLSTTRFLTTLAFVVGGAGIRLEFVTFALATTSRVLVLAAGLGNWRLRVQGVAIHLRIIMIPGLSLAFSTFFTRFFTRISTSIGPS